MKKQIHKIFFFISLLPYVLILIYAIYSAVFGIEFSFFSFNMVYGLNGFIFALLRKTFNSTNFLIILVCLTYQISYLVFRKKENKKPIWIITFAAVGVIILVVVCSNIYERVVEENRVLAKEEMRFDVMETYENADEVVKYRGDTIHANGIAGTEFSSSTMFINYDSKTISLLFYDNGDRFEEFVLSENKAISSTYKQYKVELNSPGRTLTTFYPGDEFMSWTVAIELLMEDGSVYSIDNIKDEYGNLGDFLDFTWALAFETS